MALAEILIDASISNGILTMARGDVGVIEDVRLPGGILTMARGDIGVVSDAVHVESGKSMGDVREPVPLLGPISVVSVTATTIRPRVVVHQS